MAPFINLIIGIFTFEKFGLTGIDFIILLIIIFYTIEGIFEGFIGAFVDFISFILSFLIGLTFYGLVAKFLVATFSIPHGFASAAGFFIASLVSEIVISFVFRFITRYIPRDVTALRLNHALGFIPALCSSVILLSFILTLIVSLPLSPVLKRSITSSRIGGILVGQTSGFNTKINEVFGGAVNETLNFLTVKPQSNEFINLHFKTTNVSVDEQSERQMLLLVNQERAKVGLNTLQYDRALTLLARSHSTDMFKRGYFSHYTPEGISPFDRMANSNIAYTYAGENLALAPSVALAHQGLMESKGHRENILSPNFRKVGIGAIDGRVYGIMFTQEFTD